MPLAFNGKIVNKSNADDPIAKRVVKDQMAIIKEYGLDKGKVIRFVFATGLEKPSRDNPGKLDKPRSTQIKLRDVVRDESGANEWIYFETANPAGSNRVDYYPRSKDFLGAWILDIGDIDLIFFLLHCSSRLEGGKNKVKNIRHYIKIDNPAERAKAHLELKSRSSYISFMLTDSENGLSEAKVRAIAASLFIKGSNSEDIDILRVMVEKVLLGSRDGYLLLKDFIDNNKGASEGKLSGIARVINDAIDKGVIREETKGPVRKWMSVSSDGESVGLICNVKPGMDSREYLSEFLSRDENKEMLEMISKNI